MVCRIRNSDENPMEPLQVGSDLRFEALVYGDALSARGDFSPAFPLPYRTYISVSLFVQENGSIQVLNQEQAQSDFRGVVKV